uniref:Uncharacterized protein n=1 Tax=Scophthalmus maximus TaxID=52904 RepID=A0A8D2ZKM8_SCOMX
RILQCLCGTYDYEIITPTVKMGEGSVVICSCCAAFGPALLNMVMDKMNFQVYSGTLQDSVMATDCQLTISQSWVMLQDNGSTLLQPKNLVFGVRLQC